MKDTVSQQHMFPPGLNKVLWSYNISRLEPERVKRTIIVQIINYGDLEHWEWLVREYGKSTIQEVLQLVPASSLRPHARRLASLLFGVTQFNYAPRGTH